MVKKVFFLGVSPNNSKWKNRRIILHNKLALILATISSFYIVLFPIFGPSFLCILASITTLIYISILFLNKRNFHIASAWVIMIHTITTLIFYSILLGSEMGAKNVLYSLSILPIVIFPIEKIKSIFSCTFLVIASFFTLDYLHQILPFNHLILVSNIDVLYKSTSLASFSIGILTITFFYQFYKDTISYFKRYNYSLQSSRDEISRQKEGLEKVNQELIQTNIKLKEAQVTISKNKMLTMLYDISQKIQLQFLPKQIAPMKNFLLAVYYSAAYKVSGDFYFILNNGFKQTVIVVDVRGKGPPASLIIPYLFSLITHTIHGKNYTPSGIMKIINESLCTIGIDYAQGVACAIEIDDKKPDHFTYSNAGISDCYIVRNQKIIFLDEAGGTMFGCDQRAIYTEKKEKLLPGDTIYLLTDGATDLQNEEGERLDESRLHSILVEAESFETTQEKKEFITKKLKEFEGKFGKQGDDITFFVIQLQTEDSIKRNQNILKLG